MNHKMWGGRFSESTDSFVQRFTASVFFDQRLYKYDIAGSIAHATMLASCSIISKDECDVIVNGLKQIEKEIENQQFSWRVELEDVHMNIESRLTEIIGSTGKKLHTARSRNDQVSTDMRLFTRDMADAIVTKIINLQKTIILLAEKNIDVVMPGMTHLQFAQPISFAHHVLAWFCMVERDKVRFTQCREALNKCPLGSAALAGTSFAIDRVRTSELLGFDSPTSNSLDSVSDRDFIADFVYSAAQLLTHISRWAEELILWSSTPFAWISLPDKFCTGSSIMPQKKNPDVPELLRAKSARVYGHLMAIMALMKAQPLAYNKDNQEDKEILFDSVDTALDSLTAVTGLLREIEPCVDKMRSAAEKGFITATDLADYLVRLGVAFRDAHAITGQLVKLAEEKSIDLHELSLADMQKIHPDITSEVFSVLTVDGSIAARSHFGGTSIEAVSAQIVECKSLCGLS